MDFSSHANINSQGLNVEIGSYDYALWHVANYKMASNQAEITLTYKNRFQLDIFESVQRVFSLETACPHNCDMYVWAAKLIN